MIKFLLKKSFYDAWDNMFKIFLSNLIVSPAIAAITLLIRIGSLPAEILFYIIFAIAVLFFHVYAGVVSAATAEVADFKSFRFGRMLEALRHSWWRSLCLGMISLVLLFLGSMVFLGMFSSGGSVLFLAAGIIFWINLIWLLILQYAFPFMTKTGGSLKKALYKSFLLVIDNPGKSLFGFIFSMVLGTLSLFTFFILPGLGSILLLHQNLLRILLKKYDWLEEDPARDRRRISWTQLIEEDSETLGDRKLKGLIFPWKD